MKPFILAFLVSITSFGQAFKLEGQIANLKSPTVVLVQYFGSQRIPIDTATVSADGKFTFADNIAVEPSMGRILGVGRGLDVMLDSQNMSLTADVKDLVGTIQFKNSPENEVFFGYQRLLRSQYAKAVSIGQKLGIQNENDERWKARMEIFNDEIKNIVDSLSVKYPHFLCTKFLKAFQEPKMNFQVGLKITKAQENIFFREHFFDNAFLNDERMIYTSVPSVRLNKYLKEIITPELSAKEKIASFDAILKQTEGTTELRQFMVGELARLHETTPNPANDEVYEHIVSQYVLKNKNEWDASTVQQITEMLAIKKNMGLGQPFPNLAFTDIDNKNLSLNDIAADITVVYFYDPNCVHCKERTPDLVNFLNTQKRNLKICAVSLDPTPTYWQDFVKVFKTNNFINVTAASGRFDLQKLGVFDFPTIYVLDQNKKILARYVEPKKLEETLKSLGL